MTAEAGCLSGCAVPDTVAYLLAPLLVRLGDAVTGSAAALPWLWPLAAGIAGAVAASFIGLAVHRLPAMRGWRADPDPTLSLASPPSSCDGCGVEIPAAALIPIVGWFLARGRCGTCKTPVPWIYPAVEAGTALASAAVVAALGPGSSALLCLLGMWLLLFVSWIDLQQHEIPDAATVPLFFLGALASPFEPSAWSRVAGAALAGGCVWLAFRFVTAARREDAMSYGDVALAAALGAWTGLCGVPPGILLACALYVAHAAPLRSRGTVWVPMGPALSVGFALAAAGNLGHLLG